MCNNIPRNDISAVFLNTSEFAEERSIRYNGILYENIPVVITGLKQHSRRRLAAGLHSGTTVLHCSTPDIGGKIPEPSQKLRIYDEGDSGFYKDYRVTASSENMGMCRIELERIME